MPAVAPGKRTTLKAGPWTGVYTTPDPFDADAKKLVDARNLYIPDPAAGSGAYSRPGFVLQNAGAAFYTSATTFRGQGGWTHFATDGSATNWQVWGGHLFRVDPGTSVGTDVTPVGVTIDANTTTHVFAGSLGGVMAVSDGVHRPWVASNLSSTPITGTYIDFDGMGTAWTAFGPPTVFGGSGFWTLNTVNSVAARLDIAWTEPNDWTTGYQQTNFDNRWTLEQTGTTPLTGIWGTNLALNYWRERSIGSISGAVGINLATTATHDAITTNVGTLSPQTIAQFGNNIFFCDVLGRPWMFPLGGTPVPIWYQLRGIADTSAIGYPAVTAVTASAAFEPTLNLYCVAIWSTQASNDASPTEFYVFKAETGAYFGRWSIGPTATGVYVDCLAQFLDDQGRGSLVVMGSATSAGTTGYAWAMNSLTGVADFLTLEDNVTLLTDESTPGVDITTEGQPAIWTDNGDVPLITAQTDRLGYSSDIVWLYDQATVLTGNTAPISVTVTTPNAANVLEGTPTPNASADGVYRTVCGLDVQGRGLEVTVSPTTADSQWSLQQVSVVGIANPAAWDDA